MPSQVNSASLHPDQSVFVCGGDDFKMYKFDYENGNEMGKLFMDLSHKSTKVYSFTPM